MRVKIKTKEQLIAAGWRQYGSYLDRDGRPAVVEEMMRYLGKPLILKTEVLQRKGWWICENDWNWSPEMWLSEHEEVNLILEKYG
jgi:hypothetical protein